MRTVIARLPVSSLLPLLTLLALSCDRTTEPRGRVSAEQPLVVAGMTPRMEIPRMTQLTTSGRSGPASWESSDTVVATVTPTGLLTARFPGAATITARRGGASATVALTVVASSLELGASIVSVELGDRHSLTAMVRDADGNVIGGVPVTWRSSNPAVAGVDIESGVVTSLAKGTARITASAGGVTNATTVLVRLPHPFALAFDAIGTVGYYACGLESQTGLAYCWGDNHSGALGIGEKDGTDVPELVDDGARRFRNLSVAAYSNCAVEVGTDLAYCWGRNEYGQLGDGSVATRWFPTLVGGGAHRFSTISASAVVTCGVELGSGRGYCWGMSGLVGNGMPSPSALPARVGGVSLRFTSISASPGLVCGVEAETLLGYCWGPNEAGQVGDGTRTARLTPTLVGDGKHRFTTISAGGTVACGVEAQTGHLYCWGANVFGQLGDGTTTARLHPTLVGDGNVRFSGVDAGPEMVCGIEARTGAGYCWGRNRAGSLGDGTTMDRHVPTLVGNGSPRFTSVSAGGAGGYEVCGVEAQTGRGFCWGLSRLLPTPLAPSAPPTPAGALATSPAAMRAGGAWRSSPAVPQAYGSGSQLGHAADR
jgi:alpha-tubulin suppressor-like RCC1 family protein